jgi:hypothetical protein
MVASATASVQFWRLANCGVRLGVGGVSILHLVKQLLHEDDGAIQLEELPQI